MNTYRPATRTRLATLVVATLFLLPIGHALHAGSPGEGSGFIENRGQWPDPVRFRLQLDGLTMWITDRSALYDLREETPAAITMMSADPFGRAMESTTTLGRPIRLRGHMLRATFVDAADVARAVGVEESGGRINYLIGNDPERWGRNCRIYSSVRLDNLYDGIDALFYIDDGLPRYDLIAAPGADIGRVRMRMEGAEGIRLLTDGRLAIATSIGDLEMRELISYQLNEKGERCQVTSRFVQDASGAIMFAVGEHDRSRPLVVDPLIFSTLFGEKGSDEINAVAIDDDRNIYLAGSIRSTIGRLPATIGAYDTLINGHRDAFVAKLSADGSRLLYGTYLGSGSGESAVAIAVNADGEAIVAGTVDSTAEGVDPFPTTPGAFDREDNGAVDIFVTRLSADGSGLIYSTHIGGISWDKVHDLVIDDASNAYLTGTTGYMGIDGIPSSDLFPITPGAYDDSFNGGGDAFVTAVSADGSRLLFSTFLGGGALDVGEAIAIDSSGSLLVVGSSASDSIPFPTTPGAFDRSYDGSKDAFLLRLSADGSTISSATLLGGAFDDVATGIAVDADGNAYVAGVSGSLASDWASFPTTSGAFDTTADRDGDIFAAKLTADGSGMVYATLIGSAAPDLATDVALLSDGRFLVVGGVSGIGSRDNYPTTADAFATGRINTDPQKQDSDGIISLVSADGSTLLYSSFFGSRHPEVITSVAVDVDDDIYLVGYTNALSVGNDGGFPRTPGAYDQVPDDWDGFVTKLSLRTSDVESEGARPIVRLHLQLQ